MSITIEFIPWSPFRAHKKQQEIQSWLRRVGEASERAFKNMKRYPPASSSSEYPAIRTGQLRSTIRFEVEHDKVTIGSSRMRKDAPVSLYLREGTSRMSRRKMSDDAIQEGRRATRLGRWVEWMHE